MSLKALWNPDNRDKLKNLCFSIGAGAIFNLVTQIVYIFFKNKMGVEAYGVAQTVLSVLAITAGTFGYAVGCARLLGTEKNYTASGDYNRILLAMGLLGSMIGIAYLFYVGLAGPLSVVFYCLLTFATMLRYYAEVEFKISGDFFRYMIYYVLISVGYVAGLFFLRFSHGWMLTLLAGETLCLLYVAVRGSIFRRPFLKRTEHFSPILFSVGFLIASSLIDNVTLHADRILLLSITGDGAAVTVYYAASLVGKIVSMLTLPVNAILLSYLMRYKEGLSKRIWSVVVALAAAFGLVCFGGCMIVSPLLVKWFYSEVYEAARPYLAPAVLGQIFYFVSGVLMMILLRFCGEKKQLIFNGIYAVIFFGAVAAGTLLGGLSGFILSILLANAFRFAGAVIWGFLVAGKKEESNT